MSVRCHFCIFGLNFYENKKQKKKSWEIVRCVLNVNTKHRCIAFFFWFYDRLCVWAFRWRFFFSVVCDFIFKPFMWILFCFFPPFWIVGWWVKYVLGCLERFCLQQCCKFIDFFFLFYCSLYIFYVRQINLCVGVVGVKVEMF